MSTEIKKEKGHFRRNWFFYILLLVTLGACAYFGVTKMMLEREQSNILATEKAQLVEKAQQELKANAAMHLELMMKTFVWAVRGELTRENQEQVNQYFKQLVKNPQISEVTLVDNKGTILLSTNKKNEGSPLTTDYTNSVLNIDETTILDQGAQQVVAAPVLSIDSRLGTLIVLYKTDLFQL